MEETLNKIRGVIALMEYMKDTTDKVIFQSYGVDLLQSILIECEKELEKQV